MEAIERAAVVHTRDLRRALPSSAAAVVLVAIIAATTAWADGGAGGAPVGRQDFALPASQ